MRCDLNTQTKISKFSSQHQSLSDELEGCFTAVDVKQNICLGMYVSCMP